MTASLSPASVALGLLLGVGWLWVAPVSGWEAYSRGERGRTGELLSVFSRAEHAAGVRDWPWGAKLTSILPGRLLRRPAGWGGCALG